MLTYDIVDSPILTLIETAGIAAAIEELVRAHGLNIAQKTTLSTCKGSIHYHLKSGAQRGVLEITYWPVKRRLWLDIHGNRQADWNLGLIEPFAASLAARFHGRAVRREEEQ